MTCRRLFWAVMTSPKQRVSPVKYLAYGNNSVFTDSDEAYTLLMKKPCFDKIMGSTVSRQGRKHEVSKAYNEVRLLPKLIEGSGLSPPGFTGVEDQALTLLTTGTCSGSAQNTLSYNNIPASHLLDAQICLFPLVSKSLSVSPFETPRAAEAGILILLHYLLNIFSFIFFLNTVYTEQPSSLIPSGLSFASLAFPSCRAWAPPCHVNPI